MMTQRREALGGAFIDFFKKGTAVSPELEFSNESNLKINSWNIFEIFPEKNICWKYCLLRFIIKKVEIVFFNSSDNLKLKETLK